MLPTQQRYQKYVSPEAQASVASWWARQKESGKPSLYIAGHIFGNEPKTDGLMREMNSEISQALETHFSVFLPQRDNPFGVMKANSTGWEMALVDAHLVMTSEVIFAIGGFGKDTSWECGLATGKNNFSVLYLPNEHSVRAHIDDWMLLLSYSAVIVPQQVCPAWLDNAYTLAPDLKIVKIAEGDKLGEVVYRLYEETSVSEDATNVKKKLTPTSS
jgi:hypothetical protein